MCRFIVEKMLGNKELVEVHLHVADFQECREAIKVNPIPSTVRFMDVHGRFLRNVDKFTAAYCEEIYPALHGDLHEFENMRRPNSPPFLVVWSGSEFPALLVYCYENEWRASK